VDQHPVALVEHVAEDLPLRHDHVRVHAAARVLESHRRFRNREIEYLRKFSSGAERAAGGAFATMRARLTSRSRTMRTRSSTRFVPVRQRFARLSASGSCSFIMRPSRSRHSSAKGTNT
jgi:hypothetical protein